MHTHKKKGFWSGIIVFFIILILPGSESLSLEAKAVGAVAILMAVWWATESIPVPVTALLPIALFPLLGITDIKTAAVPYANPNIYLFLGGFILALAIESTGLHKRIALSMILQVGKNSKSLIGGFMLVAALISMFVMNTSTTLMLLPIGLAVCSVVTETVPNLNENDRKNFDTALMLGIAYAATIGGMSTLVGTAPNIVFAAFMQETYGIEISMIDWMTMGVPLSALLLLGAWVLLTKYVFPVDFVASDSTRSQLRNSLQSLGPLSKNEIKVMIVFALTVFAWMTRRIFTQIEGLEGITDAGIAIIAAIALFIIPSSDSKSSIMIWEKSKELPWGLLILFGGGLSLASQITSTGLGLWIGNLLIGLQNVPEIVLILCVATMIIFLTELTSNVATTSSFLPVFGAIAVAIGVLPVALTIPVCLAASCAFMLPVATPPNAIVYGSNKFTIATMMKAGLFLNLIGIILVTLFSYFISPLIFG
jgi:sodium-dependent dicarboxylate transporter 2/3/5